MKILIIRFSSLGDIVLVSPVTRALAEWFPDAETSVAVKLMYEPIARLLPGVDTIIPFRSDQGFAAYIKTIRQREFDLVIDLHANPRSRMLSKFSGAGRVGSYDDSFYYYGRCWRMVNIQFWYWQRQQN